MEPLLLYNGIFITLAKKGRNIFAVLIDNGIIKKSFSKTEKLPQYTKKINLKKSYVIPGFIDCHTHLVSRGIELQRIDLEKCNSLSGCLDKIRSQLRRESKIGFGVNWDESNWVRDERNKLNKTLLDKISKKKPIIMRRICGHMAVVNTKALNHIARHWRIVDRKNGYLYEDVALNLNTIFKPSETMMKRAIDLATTEALAKGITSIHEITVPSQFKVLEEFNKENKLKLRVAVYVLYKYFEYFDKTIPSNIQIGVDDGLLRYAGIKLFLDGSIGAKTAAFLKPYENTTTSGRLLISTPKLERIVQMAEDKGIQLMIHSIGDRATHKVLEILKKNIDSRNGCRHRLEHIQLLDDQCIDKIAKMNLIASMQPNFVRRWQIPGGMYERHLGARYREINCFRTLFDAGVRIIFGSDCMPLGPLYGIHGAVNHPFICGRIKRSEALRSYTKEGAYATFDEDKKGTIEIGKHADLVVLDRNPLEEKILDKIQIHKVFIDGKIVYSNVSNAN